MFNNYQNNIIQVIFKLLNRQLIRIQILQSIHNTRDILRPTHYYNNILCTIFINLSHFIFQNFSNVTQKCHKTLLVNGRLEVT